MAGALGPGPGKRDVRAWLPASALRAGEDQEHAQQDEPAEHEDLVTQDRAQRDRQQAGSVSCQDDAPGPPFTLHASVNGRCR